MLSPTGMTRSRLYVLIDSFETDMRNILETYILSFVPESDALGASFVKADQRRNADDPSGTTPISAYLDLQEVYDLLNRHRPMLPEELAHELRANTTLVNQLVPIRNRVMHGRPLQTGDPENAINACIAFSTRYWSTVREALNHLTADPTWEPAFETQPRYASKTLHNLPLPEYDETGLIGRSAERKKLVDRLVRGREPIITIAGEGGIGKTALALEVAYGVLDEPTSPYECILWTSLKTQRLTAQGVQAITNAAQDLTGAAAQLGSVVDSDFRGGVGALADLLDDIKTLLVIDNIETVDGSEVLAFYEALPDNVTYLLTSRIGLGQIERKIDLGPLSDRDSEVLFRTFARARGVNHLAKLSNETVREVVTRLRNSPLAIRWYILAVEAGGRPNLTLADQSALLNFCVRSVYESMRMDAKELLTALFALDRSATFDELAILTDTKIDNLRRAVHELLNGSMVILEPDRERELVSRIRLTEAARQFFRTVEVPDDRVIDGILAKEEEYRRADEHRRADEQARELAPNSVRARSDVDKPTAHLLRLALLASREETVERALEITDRARALNPEFWEVDRVEAFILSQSGQVVQATSMYRNALRKAQGDGEGRAIVSYYFAGHLARKAREMDQAITLAREAHEYFNAPETEQQLGTFLLWAHEFEEAQGYLISALERATGKLRLITLTSLVDLWARWAEVVHRRDRKTLDAVDKAYTGFNIGAAEVKSGTYDVKLADVTLECASDCIYYIVTSGTAVVNFSREIGNILSLTTTSKVLFERCRKWPRFAQTVGLLYRNAGTPPEVKDQCSRVIELAPPTTSRPESGSILTGQVCAWRGTYGFIAHPSYPDNVFFHISSVQDGSNPQVGDDVRFSKITIDNQGKARASWVQILP